MGNEERGNGSFRQDGYPGNHLQHGYQPSGGMKPINEGYQPSGQPKTDSSSQPPSGGSAVQKK